MVVNVKHLTFVRTLLHGSSNELFHGHQVHDVLLKLREDKAVVSIE